MTQRELLKIHIFCLQLVYNVRAFVFTTIRRRFNKVCPVTQKVSDILPLR